MQNKLFIRNLSFTTTDTELSDLFATHGKVLSAKIACDRETGKPRGFAFVEMGSEDSAQDAIRALDSKEFNGREIHVAMSIPRERRPEMAYGN